MHVLVSDEIRAKMMILAHENGMIRHMGMNHTVYRTAEEIFYPNVL